MSWTCQLVFLNVRVGLPKIKLICLYYEVCNEADDWQTVDFLFHTERFLKKMYCFSLTFICLSLPISPSPPSHSPQPWPRHMINRSGMVVCTFSCFALQPDLGLVRGGSVTVSSHRVCSKIDLPHRLVVNIPIYWNNPANSWRHLWETIAAVVLLFWKICGCSCVGLGTSYLLVGSICDY